MAIKQATAGPMGGLSGWLDRSLSDLINQALAASESSQQAN